MDLVVQTKFPHHIPGRSTSFLPSRLVKVCIYVNVLYCLFNLLLYDFPYLLFDWFLDRVHTVSTPAENLESSDDRGLQAQMASKI